MSVTLICPNLRCRTVLQVPEDTRGKKVRCGRCGKDFRVPGQVAPDKKPAPAKRAAPADKA
jgi:hypothetical protein